MPGKVRSNKKRPRYHPTGVASVKESLQQEKAEHLEPQRSAMLDQV